MGTRMDIQPNINVYALTQIKDVPGTIPKLRSAGLFSTEKSLCDVGGPWTFSIVEDDKAAPFSRTQNWKGVTNKKEQNPRKVSSMINNLSIDLTCKVEWEALPPPELEEYEWDSEAGAFISSFNSLCSDSEEEHDKAKKKAASEKEVKGDK